jgi:hypothetical protein
MQAKRQEPRAPVPARRPRAQGGADVKFSRILALPFAAAADILTLGNLGGQSYTSQIFNNQRRDDQHRRDIETLKAAAPIIAEILKSEQPK